MTDEEVNDEASQPQQGSRAALPSETENRSQKVMRLMNDNEHVKIIPELIMMMLMMMEKKKNETETSSGLQGNGEQYEKRMKLLTETMSSKVAPSKTSASEVSKERHGRYHLKDFAEFEKELDKDELDKLLENSKKRQEFVESSKKNIESTLQQQNKNLLERMAVEADLLLWSEARNKPIQTQLLSRSDESLDERTRRWDELIESIKSPSVGDEDRPEEITSPQIRKKSAIVRQKTLRELLAHKTELGLQEVLAKLEIVNEEERHLFTESGNLIQDCTDCLQKAHDEVVLFVNPLLRNNQLPSSDGDENNMNTAFRVSFLAFQQKMSQIIDESKIYMETMQQQNQSISAKNAILINSIKREQIVAHKIESEVDELRDQLKREIATKDEFKALLEASYNDNVDEGNSRSKSDDINRNKNSKARKQQNSIYVNSLQRRFQIEKDFLVKLIVDQDKEINSLKQKLRTLPHHQGSLNQFQQLHQQLKQEQQLRTLAQKENKFIPPSSVEHVKPVNVSEARQAPEFITVTSASEDQSETESTINDTLDVVANERTYSFTHSIRENEALTLENKSLKLKLEELQANIDRLINNEIAPKDLEEHKKDETPVETQEAVEPAKQQFNMEEIKNYMTQLMEENRQLERFDVAVQTDVKLLRQLLGDDDSDVDEEDGPQDNSNMSSILASIKKKRQKRREERDRKRREEEDAAIKKRAEEEEDIMIDTTITVPIVVPTTKPARSKGDPEDNSVESLDPEVVEKHKSDILHKAQSTTNLKDKRKGTPTKKQRKATSPKRATSNVPPPYFGDRNSVLEPMLNLKTYISGLKQLILKESYPSFTSLEEHFFPRWLIFLKTQRAMVFEISAEVHKQENQLMFEGGDAYKWLTEDVSKILGDFDRMINMTETHNNFLGIGREEKQEIIKEIKTPKMGDKKKSPTTSRKGARTSNAATSTVPHQEEAPRRDSISEKFNELSTIGNYEEKANRSIELCKVMIEKVTMLEVSRKRNREYQIMLEKRLEQIEEAISSDGKDNVAAKYVKYMLKSTLALGKLKSDCDTLRVRCTMAQRTIKKYKDSFKPELDALNNAFKQLTTEVTDREEFIEVIRKNVNIYTNALMILLEKRSHEEYMVLRNKLLGFNRAFEPVNQRLLQTSFLFKSQVENLLSSLSLVEKNSSSFKSALAFEHKSVQTAFKAIIKKEAAGSDQHDSEPNDDMVAAKDYKQGSKHKKGKDVYKSYNNEKRKNNHHSDTEDSQYSDDDKAENDTKDHKKKKSNKNQKHRKHDPTHDEQNEEDHLPNGSHKSEVHASLDSKRKGIRDRNPTRRFDSKSSIESAEESTPPESIDNNVQRVAEEVKDNTKMSGDSKTIRSSSSKTSLVGDTHVSDDESEADNRNPFEKHGEVTLDRTTSVAGPWRGNEDSLSRSQSRGEKRPKRAKTPLLGKDMFWDVSAEQVQPVERPLSVRGSNQRPLHSSSATRQWEEKKQMIEQMEREKASVAFRLEENDGMDPLSYIPPDEAEHYLPQPVRVPRKGKQAKIKDTHEFEVTDEEIEPAEDLSQLAKSQQYVSHEIVLEQFLANQQKEESNVKNPNSPAKFKRVGFFETKQPVQAAVIDMSQLIITAHPLNENLPTDEQQPVLLPPIHKTQTRPKKTKTNYAHYTQLAGSSTDVPLDTDFILRSQSAQLIRDEYE